MLVYTRVLIPRIVTAYDSYLHAHLSPGWPGYCIPPPPLPLPLDRTPAIIKLRRVSA